MENEDNNTYQGSCGCDSDSRIGGGLAAVLFVSVSALSGFAGYQYGKAQKPDTTKTNGWPGECAVSDATQKARLETELAFQKRLEAIQLKSLDACASRGGNPVVQNGNIDCKR